ncbi:MAG: BrnT family toxin [Acidobacteriota bacterium]|nr:BrnT family toxin [Acidobacteriota bacterium]
MKFEWDPRKASGNLRKHGVSFDEAMTVFADWGSITISGPDHSEEEERFIIVGVSSRGRILVVSHVERGENVRIISARRADAGERKKHGR